MKRLKLIVFACTIVALLLSAWSIYEVYSGSGNLLQSALNLVYFFTLFCVFLCVRISMGTSGKITWVTYTLSIALIISSTYTWINSIELIVIGKYTLGLLPILVGTTLISTVNAHVRWSRYVQVSVGIIALALSACVFTELFETFVYDVLLVGMLVVTVALFALSVFSKPT